MVSLKKKFLGGLFAISLCGIATASQDEINNNTWVTKALKLQREIDLNTPLNQATFIGTHNSYNSQAYQIPMVRYIDPNQYLSLSGQLEQGVRSLELDAHWAPNQYLRKDILLCHGQNNHFGCSVFDVPFVDGLKEIRQWLQSNPDEIVLLYIERHVDGHDERLGELLENILGQYIFGSHQIDELKDNDQCVALPTHITKADILKAHKQLLIVTKNCDFKKGSHVNHIVFTGIGNINHAPYSFIDSTITDFNHYPDCSKTSLFGDDPLHTSLWRIYEDRTKHGGILRPQKKVSPEAMRELVQCGINWPTLDLLNFYDERLEAAIWSWAKNNPEEGKGQCAALSNEGIFNHDCTQKLDGVACLNPATRLIEVVPLQATWAQSLTACRTLSPRASVGMPINGAEMHDLKIALQKSQLKSIWLNYALNQKGKWQAFKQGSSHG
ncbi:MAG: phosphatidylinositol-specific phospholipase C domain-containing protein [Gammaproteobacteria bacterium]|nr:phosphatidylinositol-specific phospholipase C domain-containing protein [Gammaproteobacteria bacterium]